MRPQRPRRTDHQWRQAFEQQRRSGLSIATFCEREGLAASTFFARRRGLEGTQLSHPSDPAAAFVELKPVTKPVATPRGADDVRTVDGGEASPPAAANDGIEVVLPDGVRVRVRSGFDAALLRRVMAVLS